MKILIIGSRIPWPLHDGGAIATYNMLKGLAEAGLEITFASLNTRKHFVDDQTILKEFGFLKKIVRRNIDTGIKPARAFLNLFGNKSYNIERFESEAFKSDLFKCISEEQFDLIHFEGLYVSPYVTDIKAHVPKLLRQHNIEYHIWQKLATGASGIKKWYLKLLAKRLETYEKQILTAFDSVVCISEEDRQRLTKETAYKGPVHYIPAGFSCKKHSDTGYINRSTVYHIGSMEWMPNREAMKWFREAIWPLVEQQDPEAEFHMAGKNMPSYCAEYNSKSFRVHGEVPDQEAFKSDKSILVVPLKSGSGIRIKTIEALLGGKAVVSTSDGAAGIPVQNGVHCMIADTETEFASAIVRLINDPVFRDELAENGKKLALSLYGNEAVSFQWKQVYESLTGKQ